MLRLPWHVARIQSGATRRVTAAETVVDTGSLVVLDGRDGIGQVLTARAA